MTYVGMLEYVMVVICVVGLVLNILFLIMLVKYREISPLNSSFFSLCLSLTIADTIMLVFSNLLFKFPVYNWFPAEVIRRNEDNFLSKVPVVGVWYFSQAQLIGIIALTVNRFTAVWQPNKHRQYWWKRKHVKMAILCQWILPVFMTIPVLLSNRTIETNKFTGGIIFASKFNNRREYFLLKAVYNMTVDGVVLLLYLFIFCKLRSRSASDRTGRAPLRKKPRMALRLASSGFVIFLCYLALSVFSLLTATTPDTDPWRYGDIWFVVNDILCTSNAPVILVLNRPVRGFFLALFGRAVPYRNSQRISASIRSMCKHSSETVVTSI